ncbi:glutathione S-transferase [Meredithblackwellia eburnea MCA 4105]
MTQTTTPELKVYGYMRSPRCLAAMVVAELCGMPAEMVDTHPAGSKDGFYDEPYHSNFPFGKVPGFSHGDLFLAETTAILSYIAALDDPLGLSGADIREKALVTQWVAWGTAMAFPTLQPWLDPIRNHGFYDKAAVAAARHETYELFAVLNKVLETRKYLVGGKLSLGDVMVATVVGRASKYIFDKRFRSANPNVFKHYELVASHPVYLKHAGAIEYVEEEAQPAAVLAWKAKEEAEEKLKAANARWVPTLLD